MERIIETIETEHGQDVRFKGDLVRCKDCKHWWYGNYCDKHGKGQENADWYCADGKRKDSDSQVTTK